MLCHLLFYVCRAEESRKKTWKHSLTTSALCRMLVCASFSSLKPHWQASSLSFSLAGRKPPRRAGADASAGVRGQPSPWKHSKDVLWRGRSEVSPISLDPLLILCVFLLTVLQPSFWHVHLRNSRWMLWSWLEWCFTTHHRSKNLKVCTLVA